MYGFTGKCQLLVSLDRCVFRRDKCDAVLMDAVELTLYIAHASYERLECGCEVLVHVPAECLTAAVCCREEVSGNFLLIRSRLQLIAGTVDQHVEQGNIAFDSTLICQSTKGIKRAAFVNGQGDTGRDPEGYFIENDILIQGMILNKRDGIAGFRLGSSFSKRSIVCAVTQNKYSICGELFTIHQLKAGITILCDSTGRVTVRKCYDLPVTLAGVLGSTLENHRLLLTIGKSDMQCTAGGTVVGINNQNTLIVQKQMTVLLGCFAGRAYIQRKRSRIHFGSCIIRIGFAHTCSIREAVPFFQEFVEMCALRAESLIGVLDDLLAQFIFEPCPFVQGLLWLRSVILSGFGIITETVVIFDPDLHGIFFQTGCNLFAGLQSNESGGTLRNDYDLIIHTGNKIIDCDDRFCGFAVQHRGNDILVLVTQLLDQQIVDIDMIDSIAFYMQFKRYLRIGAFQRCDAHSLQHLGDLDKIQHIRYDGRALSDGILSLQ